MNSLEVWESSLANRAEATWQKYLRHFNRFAEWSGHTSDELREMRFREDQTAKPWERNRVENLLRQYLQTLDGEYACSTQRLAYASVRSFFEAQGMPLFLKRQDRPSGCAFGSRVPEKEEVRQIVNACEYLRTRSLTLFLKDSGLRESDVTKLRWKDLQDYGEGFMGLTIQTKKGKTKARGFVGPETTQVLELYKERRRKGTDKLSPEEHIDENPVFALYNNPTKPMRPDKMSFTIGRAISLAGVEGVTPHGLRKFWEQNIHVEHEAYQKQLNGRALTAVERAYFWKETPELFELYKKNYYNLTLQKQEFKEVEERLRREYEREIQKMRKEIATVKKDYTTLREDYESLSQKHEALTSKLETTAIETARKKLLSEIASQALEDARYKMMQNPCAKYAELVKIMRKLVEKEKAEKTEE